MAYIGRRTAGDDDRGLPVLPRSRDAATTSGLVVRRGEPVYAVLNLYPYNPGHLMVVPYRHVADLADLTDDETAELMAAHPARDRR